MNHIGFTSIRRNTGRPRRRAFSDPVINSTPGAIVASLSSSSGDWRTGAKSVDIIGSGFINPSQATVGGTNVTTVYVSPTQLTITIPANMLWEPGTLVVAVVGATGSQNYTVVYGSNVVSRRRADTGITFGVSPLVQVVADMVSTDPNRNWIQLTGTSQLTQVTAQQNGKTCLRGATGRYMRSGTYAVPSAQPTTRFRVDFAPVANTYMFDGFTGARNTLYSSAGNFTAFAGSVLSSGISAAALAIVVSVFNGASSSIRVNKRTANVTGNANTQGHVGDVLHGDTTNSNNATGDFYEDYELSGALSDAAISLHLDAIVFDYALTVVP